VLLVLALLLALTAGVGAYWFGWARYTATPRGPPRGASR